MGLSSKHQFLHGCDAADGHVGAFMVVCPSPFRGHVLYLFGGFEHHLIELAVADRSVVAFDVGVLLWLSWLNVVDANALSFGPRQ